jgi:hypothetical protein
MTISKFFALAFIFATIATVGGGISLVTSSTQAVAGCSTRC